MIDPQSGQRQMVDRSTAAGLAPEAAAFYPTLSSRPLRYRNLLWFSARHARGNVARIALAATAMGLLSLVPPLTVSVLVNSIIPRTEFDQLVFCAIALIVTALTLAGIQMMEGIAMIRL